MFGDGRRSSSVIQFIKVLKIGCSMSKYAWMCNHASPEKERMKECLLVHISVCMLMFLINVNTKLCPGVFFLPSCRLLSSQAEPLLHSNEKWQRREYHSRLWPGLAGSVRPRAPRWQSPYFWEDGPVIGLIYFTPLPCNWTLGRRFNQSCQSHHWEGDMDRK